MTGAGARLCRYVLASLLGCRSHQNVPRASPQHGRVGAFCSSRLGPANGESFFLAPDFKSFATIGIVGVVTFSDPSPAALYRANWLTWTLRIAFQAPNGVYLGRGTPRTRPDSSRSDAASTNDSLLSAIMRDVLTLKLFRPFCRRESGEEEGYASRQASTITLEEVKERFGEWRENRQGKATIPACRELYGIKPCCPTRSAQRRIRPSANRPSASARSTPSSICARSIKKSVVKTSANWGSKSAISGAFPEDQQIGFRQRPLLPF